MYDQNQTLTPTNQSDHCNRFPIASIVDNIILKNESESPQDRDLNISNNCGIGF
ncbi:hypothetical protein F0726_02326 [Acidithiobacillus caldus]|nr:hypothetical protein F0726_02326 [Acidithiobacillus caldus]